MMLVGGGLRVALATTHLPLADVPRAITATSLLADAARAGRATCSARFGIARPRILVAGLNPHAGEGGHLGREEIESSRRRSRGARRRASTPTGPMPADTLFVPERLRTPTRVLAMYHDQGLPVLKHAGFGAA